MVRTMRRWMDGGLWRRICRRQMIHSSVTFAQQTFLLSIYIRLQAAVVVKARRRRGKQMLEEEYKSLRFLAAALQKTHAPPRTETKTNSREKLFEGEKKKKKKKKPSECIGELCADPGAGQACTHKKKSFSLSLPIALSFTALSISSSRRSSPPPFIGYRVKGGGVGD